MQGLISTFHKLKYQSHSADYNSPNYHKAGKTKAHPLPLFICLAYSLSLFPPQSNLPMPDGYSSEPAVVGHACSEYFPIPKTPLRESYYAIHTNYVHSPFRESHGLADACHISYQRYGASYWPTAYPSYF